MADFCKECSIRVFGSDYGDGLGLCEPGEVASFLCEDCDHPGLCWVDHTGRCTNGDKRPEIGSEVQK